MRVFAVGGLNNATSDMSPFTWAEVLDTVERWLVQAESQKSGNSFSILLCYLVLTNS